MSKINAISAATTAALLCLSLGGCDASYGHVTTEEVKYQSPGGEGTSENIIRYQNKEVYLNGVNIAWLNFATDFGQGLDEVKLNALLDQVKAAGGNTIRWWIHANGTQSPIWNADKTAIADAAAQKTTIDDIEKALDLAEAKGIYIMPSLWSFDMLAVTQAGVTDVVNANYKLLTEPAVRQSYIDNFLTPLLNRVAGHPSLIALELFNEPETMTESWFIDKEALDSVLIPTITDIHTTTAAFSNAIHEKAAELNQEVLVTTGPKSLGLFNADIEGGTNYYSDQKMTELGGDYAALDFYAPHYYDDLGKSGSWSPFYHQASYWGLDKPIVIGEFYADANADKPASFSYFNDPIGEEQLCVRLSENKYAGGLSWQWTGDYQTSVLDCVRALSGAEVPAPSQESAYYFDENDAVPFGFAQSSETGNAALSISSTQAKSGNALAMTVSSAEGEKKAQLTFPLSAETIPEIATVNIWVYIPQATADSGFSGGKIFVKTGENWTWADGGFTDVTAGEWTLFSWTPDTKLRDIQELGVEMYAGQGAAVTDAVIYFDNVSLLAEAGPEPTPPETPTFTYHFESSGTVPSELTASSDNGDLPSLAVTTATGVHGSAGLTLSITEPADKETKPYFKQTGDGTATVSAASFWVKLSSEAAAEISGGKVYAKTGDGWDWNEGGWVDLSTDTWTEISWTPASALTAVQELGISFYGNAGGALSSAEIYIDNIQIDN